MTKTQKGVAFALVAAALSAAFLLPYKVAAGRASPEALAFALLLCGALFNSANTLAKSPLLRPRIDRTQLQISLILAVMTAAGNVAMIRALARIDPGLVSLLTQMQVFFVVLGGYLLLAEPVTNRFVAGALVAVFGIAILRWPAGSGGGADAPGIAWAVGAALAFAIMHITTRRFIHQIHPVRVNATRLWIAAFLLALWPGQLAGVRELDAAAWLLTGAAAFFGPYLSRLCLMYSVRYISAAQTSLINLLSPAFAFASSAVILGIWPRWTELVGSAIILLGTALPVLEMVREMPAAEPIKDT